MRDLVELLGKYDQTLSTHLEGDSVFRGSSKTIQNDIIQSLSFSILDRIKAELQSTSFVAIGLDETTDVSCNTQCSLTVRYVVNSEVVERFSGFMDISGKTTANQIAGVIFV